MKTAYYKPEFCDQLINFMRKGHSFESFGGEILVGRRTIYDWLEKYPEWKQAKEIGDDLALKFFETLGIAHARGVKNAEFNCKDSNPAMVMFFLKTRSKGVYIEKQVLSIEDSELEFI